MARPSRATIQRVLDQDPSLQRSHEYFLENPAIWDLFDEFACAAADEGRAHYSASHIFSKIRWEVAVETNDRETRVRGGENKKLKVGDAYARFYALLWEEINPDYRNWFTIRRIADVAA